MEASYKIYDFMNTICSDQVEKSCVLSIREMIDQVKTEPKLKMIYSGIKENSFGFVFGPSKSAKTTFCENLGLSIAAGLDSFLGKRIEIDNRKVLFISLEEFYRGRTERNINQSEKLKELGVKDQWMDNYLVVDKKMPNYISNERDWENISTEISQHQPGIVFFDSLSRLYSGVIEDSKFAIKLMKTLRDLANDLSTTIVVIHHTPKMDNSPLTIHAMAGSRVLAQDADFMIGLNKTFTGKLYVKDVAFRYAPENSDKVTLLNLDKNQWLNPIGEAYEAKLLSEFDGRRDEGNKEKLLDFIKSNNENGLVASASFKNSLIDTGAMTKQTLYSQLKALIKEGVITKVDNGQYKLAS